MDLIAEIKARIEDYYSKTRRAELKQKSDTKNYAVINRVINELSARASELTWVLQFLEPNKDLSPQLQQADGSGSLPQFLYEDDGKIKVGVHGDTDVTEEWQQWLSGNDR